VDYSLLNNVCTFLPILALPRLKFVAKKEGIDLFESRFFN